MSKLTLSKDHNPNYLAWIYRIGETTPIPKADRLVKTTINGYDIVVSKETKPGDLVAYFPVETALSEKFLSTNNLYEMSEAHRNANFKEVEELIKYANTAEDDYDAKQSMAMAKSMCGFFNKHGRVRMLKLRGEYSMGFLTPVSSLVNTWPELADTDWGSLVGTSFDTVCGEEICHKYVPKTVVATNGDGQRHWRKAMKKLKGFDRLVPDTFEFHYDTKQLGEHFDEIKPDDVVTVSVKVHGTSVIMANLPVNRQLSFWENIKKFFGGKVALTEWGNIYSSRKVIKNQYINKGVGEGFYSADVWGEVNKTFSKLLEPGMTLYGEIVGYVPGTQTFIQKNHDYGCKVGTWKFMPYRMTVATGEGKKEWNLTQVNAWMEQMIGFHPELEDKVLPLNILYHGPIKDMYAEVPLDDNWHNNLLEKMKNDGEWLLMEKNEPMCKNKVPREGVVIRIDNDKLARAWKLKSRRHYEISATEYDLGIVNMEDVESN